MLSIGERTKKTEKVYQKPLINFTGWHLTSDGTYLSALVLCFLSLC